jgi:ABC-type multidrug transport system fused ATPase/permease subunit
MTAISSWWRARRAALAVQWARVRTYRTAVTLVLGECLRHFKFPILWSVVLGVVGLGAQVGALGIIVYVVRHFEHDEPAEFHTPLFDFVLSANEFSLFVAMISVLLLLATYVQYRAQSDMFRVMLDYEQYVCRRVFDIAARLPVPGMRAINDVADKARLARLLVTVPRYSAGFVKRIVGALVPILQAVVALIALFKLDILTTFGVLAILAVSGVVLYWVNAHAIKLSHEQEGVMGALAQERGEIIKALYQDAGQQPVNFGAHLRGLAYGRAGRNYYDSLLVIDQSRLVAGLGAAVVLGMVLAIKGREVLFGGGSIAQFLAYVMALHYFSTGCRNIAGSFTALNRFYPVISRHAQLLLAAVAAPATPAVETMNVTVREAQSDSERRLTWRPGQRVGLVLPRAASREQLLPLMNSLHVPGVATRVGFVDYRLVELQHDAPPSRATAALPAAPAGLVVTTASAEVDAPQSLVVHCGTLANFTAGSLAALDDVLLVRADGRLLRLEPAWAEANRKAVQAIINEAKAAAAAAQAARGAAALALDEDLL